MIRILFLLVPIFVLSFGFAWLADQPGDLTINFGGYQYQTNLMIAAVLITTAVVALMVLWWLIKAIWTSPHLISRHVRIRRRDRGYRALSAGMIAAGFGDPVLARRKKKEAMKLLSADHEPLVHLLDAQASLLDGDHAAARSKFEAMLDNPDMRLLGLRGLYLEAQRVGDRGAAHHYAERAVEAAPQLSWASGAALEVKSEAGDWDSALRLVETQKSTKQIDRATADRRKAVLLTAKAIELLDAEPVQAKNAAIEAHGLAPDLVPAAVTAAKALFRLDELRKGAKILETAWKRQAHPEIADAYVNARLGDSTLDRLARARKLRALKQNNPESALTVARAALAAGDYKLARAEVEAAIRQEPREGAYLLLADIEEAETDDQGRVRQWLAKAVRAPSDPAWVADGYVSERWAPLSPVTGRLDAFDWRAPVERLGQLIEAGDEALAITPSLPAPLEATNSTGPENSADETIEEASVEDTVVVPPAPDPSLEPDQIANSQVEDRVAEVELQPAATIDHAIETAEPDAQKTGTTEPLPVNDAKVIPISSKAAANEVKSAEPSVPIGDGNSDPGKNEPDGPARFPIPDDPGVDDDDKPQAENRFRLF